MWSCFKLEILEENLKNQNPLCNLLYFFSTETTMRILIKHLDLSRKLEKVNTGETILSCRFSPYLCCVSGEKDAN